MNEIFTTCVFCDGGCTVKADVPDGGPIEGGDLHVRPANPAFPALCGKAHMIDAPPPGRPNVSPASAASTPTSSERRRASTHAPKPPSSPGASYPTCR